MYDTATITDNRQATETLRQIAEEIGRSGDAQSALRLEQIAEKALRAQLNIAFCGHFSAGKSTLINTLVGRDILASGPIPTSANVVYVQHGDERASVKLHDGTERGVPISELGSYLRDAEHVQSVHVALPLPGWPQGAALLDTPGIDSTDSAHRIATESALHLADVVLYVTDYHHVQSELNFQFIKMLQQRGKPVVLVVNQVDKHQEWELSFDHYCAQITASLHNWGLNEVVVYFTSTVTAHDPHNRLPQLQQLLKQLIADRDEWLEVALYRSVNDVLDQHREWLELAQREEQERLAAVLSDQRDAEVLKSVQEQLLAVQRAPEKLADRMKSELANVLDNAPITPYETRERARLYLESRQPGFKVGWLFTQKKTEQEAESRLAAFTSDFREKVAAHIDWHVKELFVSLAREAGVHDSTYEEAVYALQVPVEHDLLSGQVKPGLTSNEYVLTYMDQVAGEVKRRYKLSAEPLIEQAVTRLAEQSQAEQVELQAKLARSESVFQAQRQLSLLEQTVHDSMNRLEGKWQSHMNKEAKECDISEWLSRAQQLVEGTPEQSGHSESPVAAVEAMALVNGLPMAERHEVEAGNSLASGLELRFRAQQMLQAATQALSGVAGFRNIVGAMQQRVSRLEDSQFTIALFGAFSAGKSSFVNAMIGDAVLPVSPNPTTAAVNRLVQPQAECLHGTARITFKSEAAMEADIAASLAVFQETYRGIDKLQRQVARLGKASQRPKAKPHLAFLQAVVQGWESMHEALGEQRLVDWEVYAAYAADEHKACFVEAIDVYVDCPLTREGIQLVDTPGADSINARHTNVAFDYMKHADAVIFVTYYNHAFSQADRSFLEQLARVKESFEMDKLWFIINAADLAGTTDQLQGVHDYVYGQLVSCGINKPRLYALSSQTALWAQLAPSGELTAETAQAYRERLALDPDAPFPTVEAGLSQTGLTHFLQDFKQLAVRELTDLAVQGARKEVERALHVVRDYEKSAVHGEAEREQHLDRVITERQTALHELERLDWQAERQALGKEVAELLYYVKQRLHHQLSGHFNQAFHPSVLREDGNRKRLLKGCLHDFFTALQRQLTEEMLATALRVESVIHKSERHVYVRLTKRLSGEGDNADWFAVHEPANILEPAWLTDKVHFDEEDGAVILKQFKNAHDFFEGDGKRRMLDAYTNYVSIPVQRFIEQQLEKFHQYYGEQLDEHMHQMREAVRTQVEEHYEGQISVLSQSGDSESWRELADKLETFL